MIKVAQILRVAIILVAAGCAHKVAVERDPASTRETDSEGSITQKLMHFGKLFGGESRDVDGNLGRSRNKADPFEKDYAIEIARAWPNGQCAHHVKDIYVRHGCFPKNPWPTENGNQMERPLLKRDFKVMKKNGKRVVNPCDPDIPNGAALVYIGPGGGHVEIKTRRGFLSDYLSRAPRTAGINNKLILNRRTFRDKDPRISGRLTSPADLYCQTSTKKERKKRTLAAVMLPPPKCAGSLE